MDADDFSSRRGYFALNGFDKLEELKGSAF